MGLVQWLLYQQALVDPQNPLVTAVSIQNPKQYREIPRMMPLLTGQVTICLICGLDMVDTHLLHQLDREQGMVTNTVESVNLVNNGPQKSGCINRVVLLLSFCLGQNKVAVITGWL